MTVFCDLFNRGEFCEMGFLEANSDALNKCGF